MDLGLKGCKAQDLTCVLAACLTGKKSGLCRDFVLGSSANSFNSASDQFHHGDGDQGPFVVGSSKANGAVHISCRFREVL